MLKTTALILLSICFLLTGVISQSFATCEKSEVFAAYGFYGSGGFPENASLYGPYTTLKSCEVAAEKYRTKGAQQD